MRGWKGALTGLGLLVWAAALVCKGSESAQAAREGLALCGRVIVPNLFPFFVLSSLAVSLGLAQGLGRLLAPLMEPLFHVSGAGGAALAVGLLAGYPAGARSVRELYEARSLNKEEAERLLGFCNNCGPAFLMGAAGSGVFGSPSAGLVLLTCHWLGALCVGVLLGRLAPAKSGRTAIPDIRSVSFSAAFTGAVASALSATLNVCAYVVLFQMLAALLRQWGILGGCAAMLDRLGLGCGEAVAAGLLELSGGVTALAGAPLRAGMTAASFLMGFGGLSVLCQTLSALEGSGLDLRWALRGKVLHGVFSAGLCRLWLMIMPESVTAFAPVSGAALSTAAVSLLPAMGWGLVGAAAALYAACRKPAG